MTLLRLWRGDVNRWHSHPSRHLRLSGDTIHAHSARCAILLTWLNPAAPASMIRDCILHDAAETITGDIPYGAKRRWSMPDMSEAESDLGVRTICDPWIKLVDNLDAYLWLLDNDPREKDKPDWQNMRTAIIQAAANLNVSDDVVELMLDAAR